MSDPGEASLYSYYNEYLQKINLSRIRVACVLGIFFVPLFSILDLFIAPDYFSRFLLFRLACSLVIVILFGFTFTPAGEKIVTIIGVFVPILISGTISLMVRYHQGYESPYYAGLNLIILAVTFLYVWDLRLTAAICLAIFGSYIVPVFLYDDITRPDILINNSAFLLTTAIIGLTSAYFVSKLRYQEFESLHKLDVSQKALQASHEKLRELSELKNEFFADISHELRTPLAIIRGEAEVSLRGKDKAVGVYKEALHYIVEMSEQMNQLVSDLLFLARSESGTVTIEKKRMSLIQVLNKACREGRGLADEKGIPLHYSEDKGENFVIEGDQVRLIQLFLIILDNAVKYSNKGGEIQVSSCRQGDRVKVAVMDKGVGIPEEDIPHIFDRFYRTSNTNRMGSKGTGLGLAIAKWIVEAHDGKIIVDSTVNKGTEMMVYLPLPNTERG